MFIGRGRFWEECEHFSGPHGIPAKFSGSKEGTSRWAAMPVRWAGEQVVEQVQVQLTKMLEVKEVLLVDESLLSPGGCWIEADEAVDEADLQVLVDA